jgi:phage anti-repressor protein
MKELIKITEQDGRRAVSARKLHVFLGSKTKFSDWIKERIRQYGLVENEDYVIVSEISETITSKGKRRCTVKKEYALTVDCSKELAMVEGNEQGKRARRYFIAAEKAMREVEQKVLHSLDARIGKLERAAGTPLEPDGMTIYGYANTQRKRLYGSEAVSLGKQAVKLCKECGEEIGRVKDVRFGWVNVYPEQVLASVFEEYFKNPRF